MSAGSGLSLGMPTLQRHTLRRGVVEVYEAFTNREVKDSVEAILIAWAHKLPEDRAARVLIKPNLNNDLMALTGNSADLRVLACLIEGLLNRGYRDITVADGSNVGVDRRDINSLRRLRVSALAERYGVKVLDLNRQPGVPIALHAGARPLVATPVIEAELLISVPKVKTHCEATLSCAMKNWVGICQGQQKRHMHMDLGRNIFAINEAVVPHLIIVDGLIGMEGNGPGDGEPFRFGRIIASDDAALNDLVACRLVDLPWREVPYLVHAERAGWFGPQDVAEIEERVAVVRPIKRAPPRSKLAELSEAPALMWLKLAVRPLVEKPAVSEAAYRLRIIQDVYDRVDDTITDLTRDADRCGDCRRCEDFCPTILPLAQIGASPRSPDCVMCLYCWWVCPKEAITLTGQLNHLTRQVQRYKTIVETI